MLLSTIIGNTEKIKNNWGIIKDDYDSFFIENPDIRQRIRLGKGVEEKLEQKFSSSNMAGYEIPENILFSNSNKTMNMTILGFRTKDDEEKANHVDSNVIYVTLGSANYKLISYKLSEGRIVQTYRRKDLFQGCAIIFDGSDKDIIKMEVKDLKQNRFVEITVHVDENLHVVVNKKDISDKKELKAVRATYKKTEKRMVHFVISSITGHFPTCTFIVNGTNEELVENVKEATKGIKNAALIILPAGDYTFEGELTEEEREAVDGMLQETILDAHIRAITTVGVKLPKDFCKQYRILYLFDLDPDTGKIRCLKSN